MMWLILVTLAATLLAQTPSTTPQSPRSPNVGSLAIPAPPPTLASTLFAAGSDSRLWLVQSAQTDQFSIAYRDRSTPPNTFYIAEPSILHGSPRAAASFGQTLYLLYTDDSAQALTLQQDMPSSPWALNTLQLPPLPQSSSDLVAWVAGADGPVALLHLDHPVSNTPPRSPRSPNVAPPLPTPKPGDRTPPQTASPNSSPPSPLPFPLSPPSNWQLLRLNLGQWEPVPWPAALASLQAPPKLVMLDAPASQIALVAASADGRSTDVYIRTAGQWVAEHYDLALSPEAQPVGLVDRTHPGEAHVANLFVVQPAPGDGALETWWLRDGSATRNAHPGESLGIVPLGSSWWALPGGDRISVVIAYAPGDLAWAQRLVNQGRTTSAASLHVTNQPNPVADPIALSFVVAIVVGMIFMFISARRDATGTLPHLPAGVIPAGLTRAAAALVDFAPGIAVAALVFGIDNPLDILLQHWPGTASDWMAVEPAALAIAIHVTHTSLTELFTGSTLGKMLLGCRVVNLAGDPPHVWQVLVRNLFKIVELVAPPLLVLALLNPTRQRLGDMVARTIVVSPKPPEDHDHDPLDDFDDGDTP